MPGRSGPTLEGYVYNQTDLMAMRMQISIEELDAAGNVTRQGGAWVLGEVPPGNRSFFSARVNQAASYRVAVLSFNWLDKNVGNSAHGGPTKWPPRPPHAPRPGGAVALRERASYRPS